jgi:hypothetical protein
VGATQGEFQQSTPFRFSESQPVVDYFGKQLLRAGYAYYGSEPMYSGISGTEVGFCVRGVVCVWCVWCVWCVVRVVRAVVL